MLVFFLRGGGLAGSTLGSLSAEITQSGSGKSVAEAGDISEEEGLSQSGTSAPEDSAGWLSVSQSSVAVRLKAEGG